MLGLSIFDSRGKLSTPTPLNLSNLLNDFCNRVWIKKTQVLVFKKVTVVPLIVNDMLKLQGTRHNYERVLDLRVCMKPFFPIMKKFMSLFLKYSPRSTEIHTWVSGILLWTLQFSS